ncbi:unnamed protein product, partial [Prorocentrum cordatum]
ARALRDELRALGVSTEGCLDKESLLALLETQGAAALAGGGSPAATDSAAQSPKAAAAAESAACDGRASPPDEAEKDREFAAELARMRGLRLKELRKEMQSLGINVEGRVDRESLLELLDIQGTSALWMRKA